MFKTNKNIYGNGAQIGRPSPPYMENSIIFFFFLNPSLNVTWLGQGLREVSGPGLDNSSMFNICCIFPQDKLFL